MVGFGFNDRRYVFSTADSDSEQRLKRVADRSVVVFKALQWLERAHLFRALRGALTMAGAIRPPLIALASTPLSPA